MSQTKKLFENKLYEALVSASPVAAEERALASKEARMDNLNKALIQIYQDEYLRTAVQQYGKPINFFLGGDFDIDMNYFDSKKLILDPYKWMIVQPVVLYNTDSPSAFQRTYSVKLRHDSLGIILDEFDASFREGKVEPDNWYPLVEEIELWHRPEDRKTGEYALRSLEESIKQKIQRKE